MNLILFDFEVFKYDILLGVYLLEENKNSIEQFWGEDSIREFYNEHEKDVWVGHNNLYYDDSILEAILKKKNPYKRSREIIERNFRKHSSVPSYSWDLMNCTSKPFSLKLSELLLGYNIHTTDVDFNLNRPLTKEEKELTESYNKDDLKQTYQNFIKMKDLFNLRIDILAEFGLPLNYLSVTGTKLAALVLGSKKNDSLIEAYVPSPIYDNLELENKKVWDYYLQEKFRTNEKLEIQIGNAILKLGRGGLHSAEKKYHTDKAMYFDVSGYYNLIMILKNLLPRTMNEESKEKYIHMYQEQLKLKKINPTKRNAYKVILLAVFGAMMNEYTDFYDPYQGSLVTITGQLYIIDLLEKIKDLCFIVQTNTDGIIIHPNSSEDEQKIREIVESWETRTGFVIKKEHIYDLWQRDVNCYIGRDDEGKIIYKGDAVKNYDLSDASFAAGDLFDCKEPPIIAQGVVNCLLNQILPQDFVEKNKRNLVLFQYPCKKKYLFLFDL